MSLQFIAGGSGSGKTRYLYEKVIKESEEHPDIQYLFIVPEQYTMQTQKELVRLHPRHGLLNIDVLSFKRLAYRVFEDLGVQLPQVLDDMGKSMVIRKVAGKLKKELKLYGGHLEQPGFINQLKSQISELCQYGVSVEDLAMVEEETDRVLLKDKLRDLKTVYGGFKDYIESHYITAEEILDILCRKLPQWEPLKNSVILLDGYTGFTPVQYRLAELFMIHSRDAARDTLELVKECMKEGMHGGIIHCFSYGKEMAREYLNMGLYLGIGGVVTFKNAKKLKEVVEYAPLEQLVLETDSPYLSPEPNRGKRNSSLNLPYVAAMIAELKGISGEEVIAVTEENAKRLLFRK